MEDSQNDKRFSSIWQDSRFKPVPKKDRKVRIDSRFKSMFTDKKFKTKYLDKRGRSAKETSTENLKKFYELSSSSDDENDETNVINEKKIEKNQAILSQSEDVIQDEESEEESDDDIDKDEVSAPIRDEDFESGSTTSEESDLENIDDGFDHKWSELHMDAPDIEEPTNRLAICNMDWDRIKAEDLLVLLNSFKPPDRVIHSVKVYPSEFGMLRMKEEEVNGPKELVEKVLSDDDNEEDITEEDSAYHQEKLRQYQLSRLKYYFAIADCDTPATASILYKELDGKEYESSAVPLDLRFVPNDMTFEQEPSSIATSLPNKSSYKPSLFTNTALQQVKVNLTWDETDPGRIEAMQEAFAKGKEADITNVDLSAYLASSSSEDEIEGTSEEALVNELPKNISKKEKLKQYKELIQNFDNVEEKDKNDVHLEITWEPGLKKSAEELVKAKQKKTEELTPWEQLLKKRKERKKEKLKKKRMPSNQDSGDVELDEEDSEDNIVTAHPKTTNKKVHSSEPEDKKDVEMLELLAGDNNAESVKEDNKSNKKKKTKKKKKLGKVKEVEKFKVDTKDPRFAAIYTSHLYNIEPDNPHFKYTEGMKAFLAEKQKYRKTKTVKDVAQNSSMSQESKNLIASIKTKTLNMKKRKSR